MPLVGHRWPPGHVASAQRQLHELGRHGLRIVNPFWGIDAATHRDARPLVVGQHGARLSATTDKDDECTRGYTRSHSPLASRIPSGTIDALACGRQDLEPFRINRPAARLASSVLASTRTRDCSIDLTQSRARTFKLCDQLPSFNRKRRPLRVVLVVGYLIGGRLDDRRQAGRQGLDQALRPCSFGRQCRHRLITRVQLGPPVIPATSRRS